MAAESLLPVLQDHDHQACIADGLAAAEEVCIARGERLTALRRRVLELVLRSHAPVGAYDLLETLRQEGHSAGPPTVYRSLEFLLRMGLVHRLESLNAFLGCVNPRARHNGQYLICRQCRTVVELDDSDINAALAASASARGFQPDRQTVELVGLCRRCR